MSTFSTPKIYKPAGARRRILSIFFSTGRGQQVAVIGCLLLAGVADGLGLTTLLPVLGLLTGDASADSGAERWMADAFAAIGLPMTLGALLLAVVVALALKAGLTLLAMTYAGYAGAKVATDLRLRLLDALLQVRWGYFTRQPVGRFSQAMNQEAQRASAAYTDVANLLTNVLQGGVLILVALLLNWKLCLLALAMGAVIVMALGRLMRRAKQAGRRQTAQNKALAARLTDVMIGVKPLKAMARDVVAGGLFARDIASLHKNQRQQIQARQANRLLQEPLIGAFLAAALYVSSARFGMPIEDVLVMGLILARILASIGKAQESYQSALLSESAYWSIQETIAAAEMEREVWSGTQQPSLDKALAFRGVSMAHDGRQVLRDFHLTVPAGSICALIGPSGAGKTTLVDLLLGLHRAQSGRILLDNMPLEEVDVRAWRRQVGYVPQETVLFNDSVLVNVTLGSPDIAREEAEAAIRAAGAWDFVAKLPEGMDSLVGERGGLLSGGQRQRLAIARALVHKPKLLILDESTSALDRRTEEEIVANIRALARSTGLTVLAISHQPAWGSIADAVHRIEPLSAVPESPAA